MHVIHSKLQCVRFGDRRQVLYIAHRVRRNDLRNSKWRLIKGIDRKELKLNFPPTFVIKNTFHQNTSFLIINLLFIDAQFANIQNNTQSSSCQVLPSVPITQSPQHSAHLPFHYPFFKRVSDTQTLWIVSIRMFFYNVSRRWGCDDPVGFVSLHHRTGLCCSDGCDTCALSLANMWCPVSSFQTHLQQLLSLWAWVQIPLWISSVEPLKGFTWLIYSFSLHLNAIVFVMG